MAGYERTVLTTLEETENALVDFGRERVRQGFLHEAVQASQTAAGLARQRFEAGATDFLTVLDSERVMLEATDQLARSQTRTATSLLAVYKALGGGWEISEQQQAHARKPSKGRNLVIVLRQFRIQEIGIRKSVGATNLVPVWKAAKLDPIQALRYE